MSQQAARLDGNVLAGPLYEALGIEMTAVDRTCPTCGNRNAVGAYHVYLGAGAVLRCPVCHDIALTIASGRARQVVSLRGRWTLEVERS
jgi:Zn finger protein HypA/HybF involved in hydrogenase expression